MYTTWIIGKYDFLLFGLFIAKNVPPISRHLQLKKKILWKIQAIYVAKYKDQPIFIQTTAF